MCHVDWISLFDLQALLECEIFEAIWVTTRRIHTEIIEAMAWVRIMETENSEEDRVDAEYEEKYA